MQLDAPVAVLVRKICGEWNRAERAIKIAEQVIGEDPFPSIKELRYSGRRIVEAFLFIDEGNDGEAIAYLQDAYFDCLRAKHDAMDVAINEIAGRIRLSQEDLSPEVVIRAFPQFGKLLAGLSAFEAKIADSREERATRDEVYESIQDNFDETLELYDQFKASEELMKSLADNAARREQEAVQRKNDLDLRERELARQQKKERKISWTIAIAGVAVAIIFGLLSL